jgi:N-acetylmuramoyl-L-alanine amidase
VAGDIAIIGRQKQILVEISGAQCLKAVPINYFGILLAANELFADLAGSLCYASFMVGERRSCLRALAGALFGSLVSAGSAFAGRPRTRHASNPPRVRSAHAHKARHERAHRSKPVIVIDPGHGGTDPGTIGRGGTLEKTITLQTAAELARLLRTSGRYEVLLTRHDDRFVSLSERATYGRAHGAALIISLHADASPDHNARGTSVYIRSDGSAGHGGTDVAQPLGKPPSKEIGSAWLQYTMIDKLDDAMEMTASPVRAAHLWVLANLQIPGVLVEMGFLSNRQDENLMCNARHRLLIARLIRDAVDGYFASVGHPPGMRT